MDAINKTPAWLPWVLSFFVVAWITAMAAFGCRYLDNLTDSNLYRAGIEYQRMLAVHEQTAELRRVGDILSPAEPRPERVFGRR